MYSGVVQGGPIFHTSVWTYMRIKSLARGHMSWHISVWYHQHKTEPRWQQRQQQHREKQREVEGELVKNDTDPGHPGGKIPLWPWDTHLHSHSHTHSHRFQCQQQLESAQGSSCSWWTCAKPPVPHPHLCSSRLAADWLRGRALPVTFHLIGSHSQPVKPALASPRQLCLDAVMNTLSWLVPSWEGVCACVWWASSKRVHTHIWATVGVLGGGEKKNAIAL